MCFTSGINNTLWPCMILLRVKRTERYSCKNLRISSEHIDMIGSKKCLNTATDWIIVLAELVRSQRMYFYAFYSSQVLWMLTLYIERQLEWTIMAQEIQNIWGVMGSWYLTLPMLSCVIPGHHSCQALIRQLTPNNQMCCSCPIGPRAASQGRKLITEYNGKLWHLQTAQRLFHARQVFQPVMLRQINPLSCTKMDLIDQSNTVITSLLYARNDCGAK